MCDEKPKLLRFTKNTGNLCAMLKNVRALAQELLNYAGAFVLFGGSTVMATALGWLAHASKFLAPYEPLSWGLAGLVGAISFCLILLLLTKIRSAVISETIRRKFYEGSERVNPLDSEFNGKRILISDLVPPFEKIVRRKTFIKCEIIGPANALFAGSGIMTGCDIIGCAGLKISDKPQAIPASVIFEDCKFLECKIVDLLFFVPASAFSKFNNDTSGMHWVTD